MSLLGTSAADRLPDSSSPSPDRADVGTALVDVPASEVVPASGDVPASARSTGPVPAADPAGDGPYEMAATLLWARVLGVAATGPHEDVVGTPGGEAAAGELAAILRDEFGVALDVSEIVAARTPAGFAAVWAAQQGEADRHPTVVSLTAAAPGTPLFCFPEAGAPAIALLPFARHFAAERRVYGLQAHALEQRGIPDWSVAAAARRHVAELRLLQPVGPYLLVGHSFGGLIALEVARLLRRAGHEVGLLALIDTYLPGTARLTRTGAIIPTSQLEGRHPDRQADIPSSAGPGPLAADDGPALSPRVVADRLRQLVELPLAGVVRFRGTHRYDIFHNQGRILTMAYRPHTYEGRTVVWLADDHDEIEAWRGVLTGPASIRRILGDHRAVLRQPLITEVVAGLRADLAAVPGIDTAAR
ncbi:thioesterase of type I polyketide synthase or non-ribosomal peptide synthase like protein [Frankia torreyi]|uniref:Thioesterase of type I polyketide synthase or non-ribosomal peptide synthase like protein n=1 Tax=Frankia torreyi TaxID=1856 RepID=A0A0D8BBX3_9ACTN|nr:MULTISPECIES: thioesterase domain-containing protein [Frankia]KJE21691.1 thioesterase of type I polyketide synthase or non-ribosomal peptide synthase like protein [Frankia torreyi]KQM03741.1 thioesterase of type I polyketide synthase or non-ribosomal peptide synthase like protein [Frankia sp. CpI1-P]